MTIFFYRSVYLFIFFLFLSSSATANELIKEIVEKDEKIIINYQGVAPGFLAHNLPALTIAIIDGAENIAINLVLTLDDRLIVFNDIYLEQNTNVDVVFPDRARDDGRYYCVDFTLSEIRNLYLAGEDSKSLLQIPTFEEELALIKGLEKKLSRPIGIFTTIKKTWFHKQQGKDISAAVLNTLNDFGYNSKKQNIFLQSYDAEELQRIRNNLMPLLQMDINLVQLMDSNDGEEMRQGDGNFTSPYNYDWMLTNFGLRSLFTYADAIDINSIRLLSDPASFATLNKYIDDAQSHGLQVHTTFLNVDYEKIQNSDSSELTNNPFAIEKKPTSFNQQLETLLFETQVTRLITDRYLEAVTFLNNRKGIEAMKAANPSIHDLLPHLTPIKNNQKPNTATSPPSILKGLE